MPQYYYERRPDWGGFSSGSMVNKIIAANIIVFILEYLFGPRFGESFQRYFSLMPAMVVKKYYVWQVITYMFLHLGVWHLLFNMFIVWMFGTAIENAWGKEKFLKYYLACGLGGALFSFVFAYRNFTLGASAAGFGLFLAYAMLFPNNRVYLFLLFSVKAKHLMLFLALFQFLQGISGPSHIAYFAHLGGIAAGLLFFKQEILRSRFFYDVSRKWDQYSREKQVKRNADERSTVDSILDKIAEKGKDELSATEKRILENYRKKRKGGSD